jgi:UDP-N-acetylmuramate dehydrogenase
MTPSALRGVRLVLRENEPLAGRTTLKIGGLARFFVEVMDVPALQALLRYARAESLPLLPLGKGSNILIPDAGFPGIAFALKGKFLSVTVHGTEVSAGGGASLMSLAIVTQKAGLSGLEGLSGIPSSVGGAVRINAGAYGSEIFDVLKSVELVSREGDARVVPASAIEHGYRWSSLCEGTDIVAGATLRLVAWPAVEIAGRVREVTAKRKAALPAQPNAGSIFKNPPGQFAGRLLEECGLKGRRIGNAQVSPVHANVIVNLGAATARDVRALMAEMKSGVWEKFGVELQPEIEVLPEAAGTPGS